MRRSVYSAAATGVISSSLAAFKTFCCVPSSCTAKQVHARKSDPIDAVTQTGTITNWKESMYWKPGQIMSDLVHCTD